MPKYTFTALPIPGRFGYGTMNLTWNPQPPPVEQSIETLQFVTQNDKFGTKLLNGGEFYGPDNANLKLFKQFLAKNSPQDNEKLVISIKGGFNPKTFGPDGSKEFITQSIENVLLFFPPPGAAGRPKLIYEPARVDLNHPYEETISYIADYVQAGKLDGISLSEVGIGSIHKALLVGAVLCVELELSLLCQDILENGIIDELTKHNIPVIAYSPLCRGYLTDTTVIHKDTWLSSIKEGDFRLTIEKFSPENYRHNIVLVENLYNFAHDKKQCSLEALSLSWILALSENPNYKGRKITKILPIPGGSTPKRIESNLSSLVKLSDDDLKEIDAICAATPVRGRRYNEASEALNFA